MSSNSDDAQAGAWGWIFGTAVLVVLLLAGMVTCTLYVAKHLN